MFRPKKLRPAKPARRGASAVEFAMIAPVMIAFTFGLVELGRITLVKQTATHATREGARIAVRPTATPDDVVARVNEELALWDLQDAVIEIEPPNFELAEPGSPVTVRVTMGLGSIAWIPDYFDLGDVDLVAETSMRRESTN